MVIGLDSLTKAITPFTPISGVRSYLPHHAKLAQPRVCVRVCVCEGRRRAYSVRMLVQCGLSVTSIDELRIGGILVGHMWGDSAFNGL